MRSEVYHQFQRQTKVIRKVRANCIVSSMNSTARSAAVLGWRVVHHHGNG